MYRSILILTVLSLFQLPTFAQSVSNQNIGEMTLLLKDSARNRPVTTEIWYPTRDTLTQEEALQQMDHKRIPVVRAPMVRNAKVINQKMPLILLSHGAGGSRQDLQWLADGLVRRGFIVAAVDHYGSTYDNRIPEDFAQPWRRPLDISYVLTALLKDTLFGSVIDPKRIGAAGHSIGGYTVLALAGGKLDLDAIRAYLNTERGKKEVEGIYPNLLDIVNGVATTASFINSPPLKDTRIKAFLAMCPAIGQGFVRKDQMASISGPVYIMGAESDSIAPVQTNAMQYHRLISGSKLLIVKGGHFVFFSEAYDELKKQAAFVFVDDPSVDRHEVHKKVIREAAEFFNEALQSEKGAMIARLF
ncbi:MAG: alpha/beta fold hydrolase [Bacteroidota bacterium]|nr:alpha/beta fold hydrolase [Bacteroidota bacterium]MDP4252876.1 alpha/beta fold hydrolase [Bacteroidota bacterium]MDP4259135.1 alpha/beta fold hydrolase [Bacteroidota bacterium]